LDEFVGRLPERCVASRHLTVAAVRGTDGVKRGTAEMLQGSVITDVVTSEQAKIAGDAGAVAVTALERLTPNFAPRRGLADERRRGRRGLPWGLSLAEQFIDVLHTCPIPELARLGRTLRQWHTQILAYFRHRRCQQQREEASNGVIEKTRRLAHNFRNFENYRLRILLAGRQKPATGNGLLRLDSEELSNPNHSRDPPRPG
jgi:hypothetical protein